MIGLFFQTRSFQSRPAALSSLRSSGRLTATRTLYAIDLEALRENYLNSNKLIL